MICERCHGSGIDPEHSDPGSITPGEEEPPYLEPCIGCQYEIIVCRVQGMLRPDRVVALDIAATTGTPPEILEDLVFKGIERVQQEYPDAEGVKMIGSWGVMQIVPAEEEEGS